MNQKQQEYDKKVKQYTPTHSLPKEMAKAFLVGGIICVLGQAIMNRLLKAAGHHVLYTDKQEGMGNDSIGM